MHMKATLTTMLACRCHGWSTISYVLVPISLTWSYNYPMIVHASNVIHGDLTGVRTILLDKFKLIDWSRL